MLKEHRRRFKQAREVERDRQKIAHGNVKATIGQPISKHLSHFKRTELRHRIRRARWKAAQVIKPTFERARVGRSRADGYGPRKVILDLALVTIIAPPAIIREQRH